MTVLEQDAGAPSWRMAVMPGVSGPLRLAGGQPARLPFLGIVLMAHLALVALCSYVAFLLTFDATLRTGPLALYEQTLPWLVGVRGLTLVFFGLYGGFWRCATVSNLRDAIIAVDVSSLFFYLLVSRGLGISDYPLSVLVIDSLLLIWLIGGIPVGAHLLRERWEARRRA